LAAVTHASPQLTRVVVAPGTRAEEYYREGRRSAARAAGFPAEPQLDLHNFGGKTIERLTFTNIYLGGAAAWSPDDMKQIDGSLAAAMTDQHLNNVLAQYYADGNPTSTFVASRVLEGPLPAKVYRDTVEGFVAGLDQQNGLSGFDLTSSVFCFMLPRGVVLVDGNSPGARKSHAEHEQEHKLAGEHDEAVDSKHGLGGYHGSVHAKHGSKTDTVYYAVGVYSEGSNGIPAFPESWMNVCATFYHELCEARTDPDVEDAERAGAGAKGNKFLGWYSPRAGEIGDIPMEEAGRDLTTVMKEVPLTHGGGTVPIQLMWSNAVGGPEGPIAKKHPFSQV
jgi:hypothetical protein